MIKRLILVAIAVLILFGGLFGWKYLQIREAIRSRRPPPPPVVAVTTVRKEIWQPHLPAVGSLVAVSSVNVANEIAGKVKEIRFASGESVDKGQVLVTLDASVEEARLHGLVAEEKLAELVVQRTKKLLVGGNAPQSAYDEAVARLRQATAVVEAQEALIAKKRIRAPFAGELGIRNVDLGQYLAPGYPIVTLQALDPIFVDFSLPERHLAALEVGEAVEVQVQAYPDETFAGRVTAFTPGVQTETRTVKVRATLRNPDRRLRPGMFAEVRVVLPEKKTVLTVPDAAITYNPYGDTVFVVVPSENSPVLRVRQVVTGESQGGRVEIRGGLKLGERVVSAGQVKLRGGMPVSLDDRPAPGEREGAP